MKFIEFITRMQEYNQKTRTNIQYPNLASTTRPASHTAELPVLVPPSLVDDIKLIKTLESSETSQSEFKFDDTQRRPHFIYQKYLNDLARELDMIKEKTKYLQHIYSGKID